MAAFSPTSHRRRSILLVEDDPDVAHSFADLLTDNDYGVQIARDGGKAIERLLGAPAPDLVLLDLKLPLHSGGEVLDVIRGRPDLAKLPVVVVSAFVGTSPPGANAVLRKPVKPADLLAAIGRHLPQPEPT